MAPGRWYDFDWQRISRWCCLGTLVMLVWLLVPVARCSYAAFRDAPLTDRDQDTASPSSGDRERVTATDGFFHGLVTSTKTCYERTPLMGQQSWKGQLLVGLAGATLLTWILGALESRSRRPR